MEEKKHIDRVFQEKLKDFEVQPNPEVWKAIEQQIVKKKKRRVVPLWYRLGAAAAILLLISTGIWYLNGDKNNVQELETPIVIDKANETNFPTQQQEVITDIDTQEQVTNPAKEKSTLPTLKNNSSYPVNTVVAATKNKEKVSQQNSNAISVKETTAIAQNEAVQSINKTDAINGKEKLPVKEDKFTAEAIIKDDKNTVAENKNTTITKKNIAQAIEDNLDNKKRKKADKSNKWYVGPVVAPIQYNSFSNGSPISQSLASNSKKSNTTLAYGLKINYKLNDRLSIQSGVNSVDLSYSTRDVTAFVFSDQLSFSNNLTEQTNIEGSNTVAVSNTKPNTNTSDFVAASRGAAATLNGNLNQSISYVEVPLEAKYALTKTKLGINLVGGVSTYILNDNSVSLRSFDGTKSLGQATNINNVNFSGNLGLDLDYKFSKKIFFNISPMFKYQMNTFSKDDGGFKPYFLGVYTGLNFRF